jgi:hypothetical protein
MSRLSFSKLNDFETCPRKYYLGYIKCVPFVSNQYLEKGKKIHDLLFQSTLVDDWKGYLLGNPEYGDYQIMIDNYIAYQDDVIKKGGDATPFAAEVKFYDREYDFSVVLDRIDKFNGYKLITDYKSDNKPVQGKHDKQLLIYTFFYNKHNPTDPITHFAPLFIKKNKSLKAKPVTEEGIKEAMDWLKKNKADIESRGTDETKYPPNAGFQCKWCSHWETGNCSMGETFIKRSALQNYEEFSDDEKNSEMQDKRM